MGEKRNGSAENYNSPVLDDEPRLRRVLTLPLVILYGLGTTVGAGIYVLIGATAERAGLYAPMAFLLAAAVMAPTAFSYAEFVSRLPVSAGAAAYVGHGLRSKFLSLAVGLFVVAAGCVSAAAVSRGSIGYLSDLLAFETQFLLPAVILILGAVAAWGILESVTMAAIFTVIEVAGLLFVVGAGVAQSPDILLRVAETVPALGDGVALAGIFSGGLLAFYAFIGFEDLANVAEETERPHHVLPRAIFATLLVTTILYFLVSAVAVLSVPVGELAAAKAPLSFVFREVTGLPTYAISAIAVVAALNGGVINMIMAARILYGLARQGRLPDCFATVHPVTRTPLIATGAVVLLILTLALTFPIEGLAEATSHLTLIVFFLVNLALIFLKLRGEPANEEAFQVPMWVPVAGLAGCAALILTGVF